MRLAIGLAITLAAFLVVGRRAWYLYRLIGSGQPAPGRLDGIGARVKSQVVEVFGQRKLLKWSVPGWRTSSPSGRSSCWPRRSSRPTARCSTPDFAIPVIGHWTVLGFLEDFFGVAVLVAITCFAIIRLRQAPDAAAASLPVLRLAHRRGLARAVHDLQRGLDAVPLPRRADQHRATSRTRTPAGGRSRPRRPPTVLEPLGESANEALETVGILLQIGVILGFLVLVVYSKHLHIFLAPLNVLTKREPNALGPLLPMMVDGKPIDFENLDELDEDTAFGRGKIEDFTWKGMLDFATCTECGRCQSQCPAWNTDKPLSPKLLIMDLRDHLFAKAPCAAGCDGTARHRRRRRPAPSRPSRRRDAHRGVPESGFGRVPTRGQPQVDRPLVGTARARAGSSTPTCCGRAPPAAPASSSARSTSSTSTTSSTCAASRCWSSRRSRPRPATMLKNLENKGNPWGMYAARRGWTGPRAWTSRCRCSATDVEDLSEVDYLFWVGCAGALEDRAKKTTRAFAELLHIAGRLVRGARRGRDLHR